MRAFESSQIEIKMDMNVKKSPESVVLLIDVLVSSQFLKPME
jgi:myo-inositol-1-phosphate synthase